MRCFIALCIGFFVSSFAWAQADVNPEQQLIDLLSSVTAMQADFVQISQEASGQVIRRSTGHMLLSRPGKFRWDVKQPQPQQIIADGKQLWVYDPSLAQVTRYRISRASATTNPAALLSEPLDEVVAQYRVQAVHQSGEKGLYFKLFPKDKASMLRWIALYFVDGQLAGMRLMDHLDQVSVFSFQHVQTKLSFSSVSFKFLSPPGVETIDAS